MVTLDSIENEQEMQIGVNGPDGANRLIIYTGTAVFRFKGTGSEVKRDTLSFNIGSAFSSGQFKKAVATASLASIFNDGPANDAGWAVDSVYADRDVYTGKVRVTAKLAVRDSDGYVFRIGYQVNVLAALGGSPYSYSSSSGAIGGGSI